MSIVLNGSTGITSSGPANVAAAVAAGDAVNLQTVSLYPTVASAATTDFFGAVGATLNISGTTTVTGITACTAAQVGSIKTLIPSNASGFSITATANIVVDGATSGTYLMPQNANVQIIATSTTTFKITTIFATVAFTCSAWTGGGTGLSYGAGTAVKIGKQISYVTSISGTAITGTASLHTLTTNIPWNPQVTNIVNAMNSATTLQIGFQHFTDGKLYLLTTFSSTAGVYISGTFLI